ncbi:MAG: M24 family metallopeptidase [Candidatus Nanohalobium sp.]
MSYERIQDRLGSKNLDALMVRDDSSNPSMYYLTGFEASDPFIFLQVDGSTKIVVPQLEYSRAVDESHVDEVLSTSEFVDGEARDDRDKQITVIEGLMKENDIDKLAVPAEFPLGMARDLEELGFSIEPLNNILMDLRKTKTPSEIQSIRDIQRNTEEAMKVVKGMIKDADIESGFLKYDKEYLTSEMIKQEVRDFLESRNCETPEGTLVASGKDSSDSHKMGSGKIKSNEPVVVDIFPKSESGYFGDMTRTFVKGEKPQEVEDMRKAVKEALNEGLNVLEQGSGIEAREVHKKVCETLEKHGYNTIRQEGETESGFVHSTGHSIGLELHEPPRIAENNDVLEEGMVLTIEPGLYLPDIGGLRLEDMIIIKEDGYENLNSMDYTVEVN